MTASSLIEEVQDRRREYKTALLVRGDKLPAGEIRDCWILDTGELYLIYVPEKETDDCEA